MTEVQSPPLDDLGFTDDFFAAYEQELAGANIEKQAQAALEGILTTKKEDGTVKTFEELKAESERFFSNPLVAQNEQILNAAAQRWAQFCQGHGHDRSSELNDGLLGTIFDRGVEQNEKHTPHAHHEGKEALAEAGAHYANGDSKKKKRASRKPSKERPKSWIVLPAVGSLGLKNLFSAKQGH